MMLKNEHQKIMVSRVLKELEVLLHKAIDADRVKNLNVFEMIMVSADTLDKTYRTKKVERKKPVVNNVVEFKKK
jgi:hypothetical protein